MTALSAHSAHPGLQSHRMPNGVLPTLFHGMTLKINFPARPDNFAILPLNTFCTMIPKKIGSINGRSMTMRWKSANLQTRLYIIAATILVLGLLSSALIYLTAAEIDTEGLLGNQIEESKSYRRSLQLYGGKANLLASEFMQWFNGLWHGRTLGITVACITGLVSILILLVAYNLPPDSE